MQHKLTFKDYVRNPDLLVPLSILVFYRKMRHPLDTYHYYKHLRDIPAIGVNVVDCRGKTLKVVEIGTDGDTLLLSDGTSASWTHCCERA